MLGDFFRFWWALLFWNVRKTWFVWRGRRGPAPCQHPSDSGRAGETGCDACLHWREPRRFRRVCPALQRTPAGWRCSLDAAAVRPFWGRALALGGGAAAVLLLAGTLVAFGLCRKIGYTTLRYADFWSGHFPERFRRAQGDYYERQADTAFAAGDFSRGMLALSLAYNRNPQNIGAGLLLAQLLERTRQTDLGDSLFRRLLGDAPGRADEIASTWAGALLARGDYPALARLAAGRVTAATPRGAAWMRTWLFAVRHLDDAGFRSAINEAEHTWPAGRAEVAAIESRWRAGDTEGVRAALTRAAVLDDAFLAYYRVATLLDLGATEQAAAILKQSAAALGRFHRDLLEYRSAVIRGSAPAADLLFGSLLLPPLLPEKIEILCAELIRQPAPARFAALFSAVEKEAALLNRADVQCGLVAAAVVNDDSAHLQRVLAHAQATGPGSAAVLRQLSTYLRGRGDAESLRTLFNGLSVPREVMFALIGERPVP